MADNEQQGNAHPKRAAPAPVENPLEQMAQERAKRRARFLGKRQPVSHQERQRRGLEPARRQVPREQQQRRNDQHRRAQQRRRNGLRDVRNRDAVRRVQPHTATTGRPSRHARGEVEEVTPEMAQRWLDSSRQRYVDIGKVQRYVNLFRSGKWEIGGETTPVSLVDNGTRLANGNHRCAAVVRYGQPMRLLVRRMR